MPNRCQKCQIIVTQTKYATCISTTTLIFAGYWQKVIG